MSSYYFDALESMRQWGAQSFPNKKEEEERRRKEALLRARPPATPGTHTLEKGVTPPLPPHKPPAQGMGDLRAAERAKILPQVTLPGTHTIDQAASRLAQAATAPQAPGITLGGGKTQVSVVPMTGQGVGHLRAMDSQIQAPQVPQIPDAGILPGTDRHKWHVEGGQIAPLRPGVDEAPGGLAGQIRQGYADAMDWSRQQQLDYLAQRRESGATGSLTPGEELQAQLLEGGANPLIAGAAGLGTDALQVTPFAAPGAAVGGATAAAGPSFLQRVGQALSSARQYLQATPAVGVPTAVGTGIVGGQVYRGASDPEQADDNVLTQTGASLRAGTGRTVELFGHAARMKGKEEIGEALVRRGQEIAAGFELEPHEYEKLGPALRDKRFYTVNIAQTIPTTVALIPAMFIGYRAMKGAGAKMSLNQFWSTMMGAMGGSLASRPLESMMEAGDSYNEALEAGKSEDEARAIGEQVYRHNMGLIALDGVQLAIALAPVPKFMRAASVPGKVGIAAGRIAGTGFIEGPIEENYQEAVQQLALGEDDRPIIQQMLDPSLEQQEAMVIGAFIGAGMGSAGVIIDTMRDIKEGDGFDGGGLVGLSPEGVEFLRGKFEEYQRAGMDEEQAMLQALDDLAKTEEGQHLIKEAREKAAATEEALAEEDAQEIPRDEVATEGPVATEPARRTLTDEDKAHIKAGLEEEYGTGTEEVAAGKTVAEPETDTPATESGEIFSRTSTDVPNYDNMIRNPSYHREEKGTEFTIVDMAPQRYLELTAEMQDTSVQRQRESAHEPSLTWMREQVQAGKEIPMPILDYATEGQEGRARALFAEQQGADTMPVMVVYKSGKAPSVVRGGAAPTETETTVTPDTETHVEGSGLVDDAVAGEATGADEVTGSAPDRARNIFRGKRGMVRVEFPDAAHAELFDFISKVEKGDQGAVQHAENFIRHQLDLGADTNIAGIAQQYKETVMDAVKDLPTYKDSGEVFKAPRLGAQKATRGKRAVGKEDKHHHRSEAVRYGEIIEGLEEGDTILTATGRKMTPFPRVDWTTRRRAINTEKRIDKWLFENAVDEARARGDRFNLRAHENVSLDNVAPADRDMAEMYLFGEVAPVVPSPLRDPSEAKPKLDLAALRKEIAEFVGEHSKYKVVRKAVADVLKAINAAHKGQAVVIHINYPEVDASAARHDNEVLQTNEPGEAARYLLDKMLTYGYLIEGDISASGRKYAGWAKAKEAVNPAASSRRVADWVKDRIAAGEKITSNELFKQADEAFGGTQAEGAYTPKDAYDALELGVNLYLLEADKGVGPGVSIEVATQALTELEELLERLPTQTKRTGEQEEYQQFSTPPNLAYVANWAANIHPGDVMLEPSAGIGGLAVFAKAAGAEVIVNELSERRYEVLKEMGFDRMFRENAEQIDNILPDDVKPTVVVMNPPFSATAGRMGTRRATRFAKAHLEQALKRLEPDGRLVAITGRGMADNAATFRKWWREIKEQYNVRANLGIDGKNYRKYGTTFDVQIIVIDKTGPTVKDEGGEYATLTDNFTDLADVLATLEGVKNERSRVPERDRQGERASGEPGRKGISDAGETEGGPGGPTRAPVGGVGTTEPVSDQRAGEPVGERESAGDTQPDPGATEAEPGTRPAVDAGGSEVAGESAGRGKSGDVSGGADAVRPGTGRQRVDTTDKADIQIESREETKTDEELTDSVYTSYAPQRLAIPGAKEHPGDMAQSAAMAAVEPPAPTYTPNLPKEVIDKGLLSLPQLEVVVYAGQAHEQVLPDGQRRGFFIGDGTGVGKGREIAGIIMDNMRQGRKKAVWVSKNMPLFGDAVRDWTAIGGDKKLINSISKTDKGAKIEHGEGILFTTFDTLATGLETSRAGDVGVKDMDARINQLVDWLGKDFDGVIAFDEAHMMRNCVPIKGARGTRKPTLRALAGVELQNRLPDARIVYVSATGASEVYNLGYAERLGLWGRGTEFANKTDFINEVSSGGLAAMELIARDMKALGVYAARNLSYDGVTYDQVEHDLTKDQAEIYDVMARSWQIVLQNIGAALEITGGENNATAKRNAIGQFWGAQQRFFSQVLTSMQMPSVLRAIKKDIEDGHAAVLQLVNTNETAQDRQLAKHEGDPDALERLDITPREMLMRYLDKSFPTIQHEEYTDKDGNVRWRPVEDSQGNPVHNREALKQKENLMAQLAAIKVPDGPLEMILNEFGPDNVAEITGRTRRVVRVPDDSGRVRATLEKRTERHRKADVEAFMNDEKRILVFSAAGGTGRSYHADNSAKNKRRRMHYLIQAGWEAETAVQGFGRTHRSNQASAPHYRLATTNLKGQKRFISSIARRLDQLGALTKGQRQTGSQGLFSAKDNLESDMARDALQQFYSDLAANQIAGIDGKDMLVKMGLEGMLDEETGYIKESADVRNTARFLNRILVLESHEQNLIFDEFHQRLDRLVETAIAEGTLDVGLETFRADRIEVIDETTVYTDEGSGAETKYIQLEAHQPIRPVTFKEASGRTGLYGFYRNTRSKRVYAVRKWGQRTLATGQVVDLYRLEGQDYDNTRITTRDKFSGKNWERLDKQAARKPWNEALKKLPTHTKQKVHLISGALLPIWKRLPKGHMRIVRVRVDDGRVLLGRRVPEREIDATLEKLGAGRTMEKVSAKDTIRSILDEGKIAYLANGWRIIRRRVAGDWRLEVIGRDTYVYHDQLIEDGVIAERINYVNRFFIPTGDRAVDVFERVTKDRPVADVADPDDVLGSPKKKPKKKRAPKGKTEDSEKANVTKIQILKTIERKFSLPLFTGRLRRKKHAGEYYERGRYSRIAKQADFETIAHELGHHLGELLGVNWRTPNQELEDLGKALYPEQKRKTTLRKEGFAEVVRLYMMNPDKLHSLAPSSHVEFQNALLEPGNEEVRDAVYEVRGLYQAWFGLDPVARVSGHIVGSKSLQEKKWLSVKERIYRTVYDAGFPILKLVQETFGASKLQKWRGIGERPGDFGLDAVENPYILYRVIGGGRFARIQEYLTGEMETVDGKLIPGLLKVLEPVREHISIPSEEIKEGDSPEAVARKTQVGLFETYLTAKHAVERHAEGKATGIDDADAWAAVRKLEKDHPEFKTAAKQLYDFQDAILDQLAKAGVVKQEAVNAMRKAYRAYVPFHRLFEGEEGGSGRGGGKRLVDTGSGVRRAFGSERMIIHPLETIYKNSIYLIDLAGRNQIAKSIVGLVEHPEASKDVGKLIHRVPTPIKPQRADITQMREMLEESGVDVDALGGDAFLESMAMTFMPARYSYSRERKENVAVVMQHGVPTFYRFHPELYRVMQGMDEQTATVFLKFLEPFATTLRAGAIFTPEFIPKNPMRDIMHATVMGGFAPWNFFEGLWHASKRDETYKNWVRGGGPTSTFISADRDIVQGELRKALKNSLRPAEMAKSIAMKPLEGLIFLANYFEEGTRVGTYARTLRKEEKKGTPRKEAEMRAIYKSREISVDFGRRGPFSREYNQASAFFNATIQGSERAYREFKRNPAAFMLRGTLWITLPTIILFLRNYNDDRYWDLTEFERDFYWIILTEDSVVRIPKPFEVGIMFGTVFERAMRAIMMDDPEAFKDFDESLKDVFGPNLLPNLFVPWVENYANRHALTGLPLFPARKERLAPQEQFTDHTTEIMKTLGKVFDVSPAYLENYVRGWSGGLGIHFLKALDFMATKGASLVKEGPKATKEDIKDSWEATELSDIPGIKAFVVDPKPGRGMVNQLYDELEELEERYATARDYRDRGQPIPDKFKITRQDKAKLDHLRRAERVLAEGRKRLRAVQASEKLTRKEKKKQEEFINKRMGDVAARALGK